MNNNPLKQYFRRPSIYIKLPSLGKFYDSTVIQPTENGEIPVYPMTAVDEVTSRTPDALFNGHAVTEIIKSCIPAILDPWKINSIDLDTLLISIRIASNGNEMDMGSTCPECETDNNYSIDLVTLLGEQRNVDYEKTLNIRELEIKFKPLTYSETNKNNLQQYELQKTLTLLQDMEDNDEKSRQMKLVVQKLNELMNTVIASTIDYIKTPETTVHEFDFIKEFLENCDRQTNTVIKDYSIKLREDGQLKPLHVVCTNCQHEYKQPIILNLTDFFA